MEAFAPLAAVLGFVPPPFAVLFDGPWWAAYFYGFVGSIGLEIVYALSTRRPKAGLQPQYESVTFWVLRFMLACIGGVFAGAAVVPGQSDMVYLYIGAATPALLTKFARGEKPD